MLIALCDAREIFFHDRFCRRRIDDQRVRGDEARRFVDRGEAGAEPDTGSPDEQLPLQDHSVRAISRASALAHHLLFPTDVRRVERERTITSTPGTSTALNP